MNAFNRLVMLILALLLVVVPVLLLLIVFGVLTTSLVNQYTGYESGLQALGNLSASAFSTGARIVMGVIGLLVALIALLLLLRELTFGRTVDKRVVVDETPGRETVLTTSAVKALTEGAAREAGAVSPSASLASQNHSYLVSCGIRVPPSGNYAELTARTRDNIRRVLEGQGVPVRNVEVTAQGTAS